MRKTHNCELLFFSFLAQRLVATISSIPSPSRLLTLHLTLPPSTSYTTNFLLQHSVELVASSRQELKLLRARIAAREAELERRSAEVAAMQAQVDSVHAGALIE